MIAFIRKGMNLTFLLLLAFACDSNVGDDAIPVAPFDPIQLNLTLPSNVSLLSTGGYTAINTGGTRGIILYRKDVSTVLAFERNCSFQPLNACATVEVHNSGLYMNDACCNSTFRWEDGNPTGGPAWRSLLQYGTSLNGTILTITDQVLNP
jgi:hypothetical protein